MRQVDFTLCDLNFLQGKNNDFLNVLFLSFSYFLIIRLKSTFTEISCNSKTICLKIEKKRVKKCHHIYSICFSYPLFKVRMFTLFKLTRIRISVILVSIFCSSAKKSVGCFMKDFILSSYNMRKSLC